MAETICKCVCGAEARVWLENGHSYVYCTECGWSGQVTPTESEAVAAWNKCMRPRPVVTIVKRGPLDGCRFECARSVIAMVQSAYWRGWHAEWDGEERSTDTLSPMAYAETRSWLIAKLTAAGFDVAEREEGK